MPIHRSKRPPRRDLGVSRLEALLALTVIAVLTAVLLPRLADLRDASQAVQLAQAAARVRAAASVFHGRCEMSRRAGSDCAWVDVDGVRVQGVHGWPAATAEGIGRAAALAGPLHGPIGVPEAASRPPSIVFSLGGSGCRLTYVQAAGPDDLHEVDIVDASCH